MTIMFDAANGFISLVGINGRHQSANKKNKKRTAKEQFETNKKQNSFIFFLEWLVLVFNN